MFIPSTENSWPESPANCEEIPFIVVPAICPIISAMVVNTCSNPLPNALILSSAGESDKTNCSQASTNPVRIT